MPERLRLYDTFQFSEPHEAELLLAKLHIESELVERWIIVENDYTHKGGWKGRHLEKVLNADARFDEFRDRIVAVELSEDFAEQHRYRLRDRAKLIGKSALPGYSRADAKALFVERPFYYAERRQRNAALDVLRELATDDAWVLVTDVDEVIDGSSPARRDQIVAATRTGAPTIRLRRRRFNWDVDNYCPVVRFVGGASLRYLFESGVGVQDVRLRGDGIVTSPDALVFEYSFCYARAGIERKLATFLHQLSGAQSLDVALRCNHAIFRSAPTYIDPSQWYEKIALEQTGAPRYIMENLERLTTGNVPADYREQRARQYPDLFGW